MSRRLAVLLAVTIATSVAPSNAGPLVPSVEGPDIPPTGPPGAVVKVFEAERFDGCAGTVALTRQVEVPVGDWDRIILVFSGTPDGDPWDRLFSVSFGDVEVLRGTTPRTTFTVRRDVTEYATLLPPGTTVPVSLSLGSFVGAQLGSVTLEFYPDEPTGELVRRPWDRVTGVFNQGSLNGNLQRLTRSVAFPPAVPSAATIELTISNHAQEEAQFHSRFFRVYADGVELSVARAMPYTYAIIGFGGPNSNQACSGPAPSAIGDAAHPVMWWTAQQALDVAGVHLGVGEIPPFRAQVEPEHLPLLAGARTIEVVQIGGAAVWITSLSVLFTD